MTVFYFITLMIIIKSTVKKTSILFIILYSNICFAGIDFTAKQIELSALFRKTFAEKNEVDRVEANLDFTQAMGAMLKDENSFSFPFDSLVKFKIMLESPDKEVRIFTWNLSMEDESQRYFGFIQHAVKRKKQQVIELYKLTDNSDNIKNPEMQTLDNTNWYGAFYYKIIETKKKKKKHYTLLGWDGNTRITNKKLIDILFFDGKGLPKFGQPVLVVDKQTNKTQKRFILEYKAGLTVSLRYYPEKNVIIFDHLSPEDSSQKGHFQYYGPDLSLDAFVLDKKGRWIIESDFEGKNEKDKKDKDYKTPQGDGK